MLSEDFIDMDDDEFKGFGVDVDILDVILIFVDVDEDLGGNVVKGRMSKLLIVNVNKKWRILVRR